MDPVKIQLTQLPSPLCKVPLGSTEVQHPPGQHGNDSWIANLRPSHCMLPALPVEDVSTAGLKNHYVICDLSRNHITMERLLWLNLADIGEKERNFLLDAPVLPSELFDTSVETVVRNFKEANISIYKTYI